MKIGLTVASGDPEKMLQIAVMAEKHGFDSLWVTDHLISRSYTRPCFDCWTMITAIATKTNKILVGSGVSDTLRRHPVQLAQTAATLEAMFPGRILLGLGAGEAMNLLPYGFEFDKPLSHLKEAILVIKALWGSTPDKGSSFRGEYYHLDNAFLPGKLEGRKPPIYLAAWGRKAKQLVGEQADGWYPMLTTPRTFAEDSEEIRRYASAVDRERAKIDCVARVYSASSKASEEEDSMESARKEARVRIAMDPEFAHRLDPKLSLEISHNARDSVVTPEFLSSAEAITKEIPEDVLDQLCAAGSPEQCISSLEHYAKQKARHIVLTIAGKDPLETVELYGSKIIPYLKENYE